MAQAVGVAASDPIGFPPIPLASGTTSPGKDGGHRAITSVSVVITTEDGHEARVALRQEFGGWWAPQPLPEA